MPSIQFKQRLSETPFTQHLSHLTNFRIPSASCGRAILPNVNINSEEAILQNVFITEADSSHRDSYVFKSNSLDQSMTRSLSTEEVNSRRRCPICGRHITNPSNLRKHINRLHGNQVYQCTACHKTYRVLCDLRRHAVSAHNIRIESNHLTNRDLLYSDTMNDFGFDEFSQSDSSSRIPFAGSEDSCQDLFKISDVRHINE